MVHAAHHLEDDAREIEIESTFQELEAEFQQEEAARAIDELREYELRLRESLKQVRALKNEHAIKEWKKKELQKYVRFLDNIKVKFHL